jgi:TldD protein
MKPVDIARMQLLQPGGITDSDIEKVLGQMLGHSIDWGDVYFQNVKNESFSIEDGIVKNGSFSLDQGVGVRAIAGDKTGFAYSDDILLPALEQAATAAKCIAVSGQNKKISTWNKPNQIQSLYSPIDPIQMDTQKKITLLKEIDAFARKESPKVKQVMANLTGVFETVLIVNSHGVFAADVRPMVRLNVTVIAQDGNRRETGTYGGGGRHGYELFLYNNSGLDFAKEAVRQALVNLEAVEAPAGNMTVVLGSGWPGVLLHEAVGHGLEGDFNRKGSSNFSGRIGEKVASSLCTVIDDGTLEYKRGSLHVDDEGTPTQRNVLIEKGILKMYMQDKLNASLMNVPTTGNGRRESYSCIPMPRMTNTFMENGEHNPQEIISSVEKGLYAVNFSGGSVDITSGKFVFSASEAYLIENGKITQPVKGATLIGDGPDVMKKVKMVGNDLKLDTGIGTCGKDGQSVPVCVGQPTIRVDNITVGGTKG